MDDLPFSAAAERNRGPILAVLERRLQDLPEDFRILEIGSGTGQHAVGFATALAPAIWQPTDRMAETGGLEPLAERVRRAGLANLSAPLPLDVEQTPWPLDRFDAVYSANTAHIMSWSAVQAMFAGVAAGLAAAGRFFLYGPFRYDGVHTAPSNQAFDLELRARAPHMGIRDLQDLQPLADGLGLSLEEDIAMPANNRVLIFRRVQETAGE